MVACPCLVAERERREFGVLWSEKPMSATPLSDLLGSDLLLPAPNRLALARRHLHSAARTAREHRMRVGTLDLQRVLDIWLGKEEGVEGGLRTIYPILDASDLLVFFVGYGEMVNKEKPAALLKVLDACLLRGVRVWVVLDDERARLSEAYSEEVARRLGEFKSIRLRD